LRKLCISYFFLWLVNNHLKKFSFTALSERQNRQLIFSPKIPYNLVAEPAEAGEANLTIPRWCSILKIVRTFFVAAGGKDSPA